MASHIEFRAVLTPFSTTWWIAVYLQYVTAGEDEAVCCPLPDKTAGVAYRMSRDHQQSAQWSDH